MKKNNLLLIIGLVVMVGVLSLTTQFVIAGANDSSRCKKCHEKQKESWENSVHAEKKIDCLSCHKRNMKLRQSKKKLCSSCHTTGEIEVGQPIEMPQQEMNKGVGGFGVRKKELPAPMYQVGVPCTGCHMPEGKDHSFEIVEPKKAEEGKTDACISCHTIFQPQVMQRQFDRWQNKTENLLKKVDDLLEKKKEFKEHKLYQKAKTNYQFIKKDGSKGVHNPRYASKLLNISVRMLESLK